MNNPSIKFADNHQTPASTSIDCQMIEPSLIYALEPFSNNGIDVISKAPVAPNISIQIGSPIMNNAKFVKGPATAMCPFCLRVTRPETNTAPGAMKTIPRIKEIITPNCKPLGSALNSAQQPYFFATILCSTNTPHYLETLLVKHVACDIVLYYTNTQESHATA